MWITARRSRWGAWVVFGCAAARASAAPLLTPCSHCVITASTAPARSAFAPRPAIPRLDYDLSFRSRPPLTGVTADRFAAQLFGSGHDGFSLETQRRVVKRAYRLDRAAGPREKLSAASLLLHYGGHVGDDDMLSLGFGGAYEKRRFALDLSNGHMVRSRSVGIEGAWDHGAHWRLSAGYRDDIGGRSRSPLARSIELAEGAGRTQQGPWMAIGFSPTGLASERPVSLGMRMQSMRLSDGDRRALGAASAHDDRLALTMSMRFR